MAYILGLKGVYNGAEAEYLIPTLQEARSEDLLGGIVTANGQENDVLFGDGTWAGATEYIILSAGTSTVNVG